MNITSNLNCNEKKWYIIDVKNMILGRIASIISCILRGKNKTLFVYNLDVGDFVIIINASKIKLSGKKWKNKIYYNHSGYPGGLKKITALDLFKKNPCLLIKKAVFGMMPKNRLSNKQILKLHIYNDNKHKHFAQKPEILNIKGV